MHRFVRLYPVAMLLFRTWKAGEKKLFFKMIDEEGRLLLNNGIFEYK